QLARRLLRAGEPDAAIAELQRAQGDPRLRREVPFLLGRAFQDKGYLDLAAKEYGAALEGLPPTEERAKEIRYNLSLVSEQAGDLAAAREHLARVFEVDIGFRDVAVRMARLRGGA
ncbi:MAG TPA: hypothetical protein VJP77_08485, partial [Planctomycetota bacterium]|nr:hypothetical protein [Planctomycetota bacterium]